MKREILSFLRFCQVAHTAVTIALARHYVARFGTGDTPAREALRRFVRASRPTDASTRPPNVAAFLSKLAVEHRASVSTQKQALNALVFLMQEALHRSLGEPEKPGNGRVKAAPTRFEEKENHVLRLRAAIGVGPWALHRIQRKPPFRNPSV